MLLANLIIVFRNLRRSRGYTAMNVVGLAVGVTCCLFIVIFIRHELAHDRSHEQAERIMRVATHLPSGVTPLTPSIVGPLLKREVPEVEESTRLFDLGPWQSIVVRRGDRMFEESRFFYADSTVFNVFTFPLVAGDAASALRRPYTLVLTEPMAQKYFGEEDPQGATLLVNNTAYEVTGILAPLPTASHLQFDFLAAFETVSWAQREIWSSANFNSYVLLSDAAAARSAAETIERIVGRARASGQIGDRHRLVLEPLLKIHLDVEGRRRYVYVFLAIAILILLTACVNYMNLTTARAVGRAKEIGIRKASGAGRVQLLGQFFGEAAVMVAASLGIAVGLTLLLAPVFQSISGQTIPVQVLESEQILLLGAIWLVVTVIAGSYPALLLSSFRPAAALKGVVGESGAAVTLRRGLVTFQFAVSVFLLIGTAAIYMQLRFIQSSDHGFRGDHVIALPIGDRETLAQLHSLKRRVEMIPDVESTAAIDRLPGGQTAEFSLMAEGVPIPERLDYLPIHGVATEAGVARTLGLEMLSGSDLRGDDDRSPKPGEYTYLINEATLRVTGWTPEEAIGKRMTVSGDSRLGVVVGVFRDYHFLPLRESVGPLALFVEREYVNNLLVRLSPGNVRGAIREIEELWGDVLPHRPFTYSFLDDAFAAHYGREEQIGRLFASFALLAVFIACLGLLGLSAHSAQRRKKEIGVRRVLGASISAVVALLSREFAALVGVGFVLAVPVAYWMADQWLDGFAYRIALHPNIFLAAGSVALAVALVTVSYHAYRAAAADPAKSLRLE